MNVVIFGVDDVAVRQQASDLARHLNLIHIDAHDAFSEYLLSSLNSDLEKREHDFVKKISKENAVISIDHDMFISNKNYKIFKNSVKIHINFNKNDEILKNINNLLKINSDLSMQKLNYNQIEIYLNNKK